MLTVLERAGYSLSRPIAEWSLKITNNITLRLSGVRRGLF